MKALQIYNFSMAAGGSFALPVEGSYFRILTCTGNVGVIGDTFGRLSPINRGQGLQNTPYKRLTITDASGAPNVGTILVSEEDFIDQTLYGSITLASAVALDSATLLALEQINVRPEAPSNNFNSSGIVAANTATAVFLAAANTNGAIVLNAQCQDLNGGQGIISLLAKATAPANFNDGDPIFVSPQNAISAGFNYYGGVLPMAQFIPSGLGLYWISNVISTSSGFRACRYKLL